MIKNSWTIILWIAFINSCGHGNRIQNESINTRITLKVIRAPGSVEIADFNNDGLPDIVVAGETDSSVAILLGNGKGGFETVAGSPFYAGSSPNDIAIADIDHDGNLDLALANHERKYLTLLKGNGRGNFTSFGNSPVQTTGIPHTHGIALGDFNSDGNIDLVTDSWGDDQVELKFGDSANRFNQNSVFFKAGKRPYQRLRAADVNKDGHVDLVTTNTESNDATIMLGDGKGSFISNNTFACGDNPFGLAIGDVNGDNNPDLAIINSPGSMAEGKGKNGLTILLGNGAGDFRIMEGSPFEAGQIPNRVAIGDINGDGINDIVCSDNGSNRIYKFVMDKKGLMTETNLVVGMHPKGLAVVDLNGDGKGDIIVCINGENSTLIILSN